MRHSLLIALAAFAWFGGCRQGTSTGTFSVVQGKKDGHPLFATVDSGLLDRSIQSTFPWFLSISTTLKHPTEDGLTTNQEASELNDWEDSLQKSFAGQCRFVYVGRVTWNGKTQLLYYLDKPDCVGPKLKKFADSNPEPVFDFKCERDEHWERVAMYLQKSQ